RDRVVPVAADLDPPTAGQVAGGEREPGGLGQLLRQEASLKGFGDGPLALVELHVVDRQRGAAGELPRELALVAAGGHARTPERQRADRAAARAQRRHDPAAQAEPARGLGLLRPDHADRRDGVVGAQLARAYRDRDGVVAARVDGLALDLDRRLAAGGVGRAAGQADDRAVLDEVDLAEVGEERHARLADALDDRGQVQRGLQPGARLG